MIRVLYFAALRDAAGCAEESVAADGGNLGELWSLLSGRHAFPLARERVRVACNGEFAAWGDAVHAGDEVAFLPPVSGG